MTIRHVSGAIEKEDKKMAKNLINTSPKSEKKLARPRQEQMITLKMAKELAMLENAEARMKLRRYLIEVEEQHQNKLALVAARFESQLKAFEGSILQMLEEKVVGPVKNLLMRPELARMIDSYARVTHQSRIAVRMRLYEVLSADLGFDVVEAAKSHQPPLQTIDYIFSYGIIEKTLAIARKEFTKIPGTPKKGGAKK